MAPGGSALRADAFIHFNARGATRASRAEKMSARSADPPQSRAVPVVVKPGRARAWPRHPEPVTSQAGADLRPPRPLARTIPGWNMTRDRGGCHENGLGGGELEQAAGRSALRGEMPKARPLHGRASDSDTLVAQRGRVGQRRCRRGAPTHRRNATRSKGSCGRAVRG